MSSQVSTWIHDYFVRIAQEHGILDSRIPKMNAKMKSQLIKFLTFERSPGDKSMWVMLSDRQYCIPVRLTAEALDEYEQNPYNKTLEFTKHKGALLSITNFTPCFRRFPIQEGKALSSKPTLSLDIDCIKILSSSGEDTWSSPKALEKDSELGQWITEMSKENGNINMFKVKNDIQQPREIQQFNNFATQPASSPAPQAKSIEINKQERKKIDRTSKQRYEQKWKRSVGDALKVIKKAHIPRDVKLKLQDLERPRKTVRTGRNALDTDSSQATRQSTPPSPSTPPQWASSSIIAKQNMSEDEKSLISRSPSPLVEQLESELQNVTGAPFENYVLQEQVGATRSMPWNPSSSQAQKFDNDSSFANYEVLMEPHSTVDVRLLLSSARQEPRRPHDTMNPESSSPTISHELHMPTATFSVPPPTPAQRAHPYVSSLTDHVEPSLPVSSLPFSPTSKKSSGDTGLPHSSYNSSHYITQVNRKVPVPKQGPPNGAYRNAPSNGKPLVLVPASEGSGDPSQSRKLSQSQSNVPGPEVIFAEHVSTVNGKQELNHRSLSAPPIEFIPEYVASPQYVDVDLADQAMDSDEEKDELDAADPAAHDRKETDMEMADHDDMIIQQKLKHSTASNTRSVSERHKMENLKPTSSKHTRIPSSSLEIMPSSMQRPPSLSLPPGTHIPSAWMRPSYQAADEKKKRTLQSSDVSRKRKISSMSSNEDDGSRPQRRQKIKIESDDSAVENSRRNGVVSVVERLRRVESTTQATRPTNIPLRADVAERNTDVRENFGRKLESLKISLKLSPPAGISLLTQQDVQEILLRTGKTRYKQSLARTSETQAR